MDFTAGLMPLDTALTQMLDRISPLQATETLPLLQAFSRVTAHDVVSPLDVPGFDNSAMDGYAVRWPTSPTARRCRLPVRPLPANRSTTPGRRAPVSAS